MPAISRYLASPLFLHPGQDRGVTALAQMCRLSLLPPILLSLKTEIGKAGLSTAEPGKNSFCMFSRRQGERLQRTAAKCKVYYENTLKELQKHT